MSAKVSSMSVAGTPSPQETLPAEPNEGVAVEIHAAPAKDTRAAALLQWQDITYSAPKTNTPILNGCSGAARAGELLAIMGSSGAGKTTLLNCLADRTIAAEKRGGTVLLCGQPLHAADRKRAGGSSSLPRRGTLAYITQDDLVMETMTARECISFSARLRLPPTTSEAERARAVENTIVALGLERCADTFIGNPTSGGLSGGERKRVCIGVELVTNPRVLLVDEPTSGLDAFTALEVVRLLRELAESGGRIVVMTIHQPSSEIFELATRQMLLHRGRVIFGGRTAALAPFVGAEFGMAVPPYHNPADFVMCQLQAILKRDEGGNGDAKSEAFAATFEQSVLGRALLADSTAPFVDSSSSAAPEMADADSGGSGRGESGRVGFVIQFAATFKRALKNYVRNKVMLRARMGQALFFGLLTGGLWFDIDGTAKDDATMVQDRLGFLFFGCVNSVMLPVVGNVMVFPAEKKIMLKEARSAFYDTAPYYWSKILAELPFQVVTALVTASITHPMVGLRAGAASFWTFACIHMLTSLAASSYGLALGASAPTSELAMTITPIAILPSMLLGGFLLQREKLEPGFVWLENLSLVHFTFKGLLVNEFGGNDRTIGMLPGEEVLKQTGFDGDRLADCFAGIALHLFVMQVIVFVALVRAARAKSGK